MAFFTPPGIVNLVKEGKLRALAVTTAARSPDLPDVPTMQEIGIDIDITNWNGFFAPAGTPQPIVDRLVTELRHVVLNARGERASERDVHRSLSPRPRKTPSRHIETDLKIWKDVIDTAQLKFSN